jgi:hypothetical protein
MERRYKALLLRQYHRPVYLRFMADTRGLALDHAETVARDVGWLVAKVTRDTTPTPLADMGAFTDAETGRTVAL